MTDSFLETRRAWWRLRLAMADLRLARAEHRTAVVGRREFIARREARRVLHEEPLP